MIQGIKDKILIGISQYTAYGLIGMLSNKWTWIVVFATVFMVVTSSTKEPVDPFALIGLAIFFVVGYQTLKVWVAVLKWADKQIKR